jgi:DNA-binding NarL/FixJ family response regulator
MFKTVKRSNRSGAGPASAKARSCSVVARTGMAQTVSRQRRPARLKAATVAASAPTRVLLAVPTRLYSESLERALEAVPGLEIVGVVAEVRAVPDAVQRLDPDVLLLDFSSHLIPRLGIAARVMRGRPGVKVLGLLPVLHPRHARLFLHSGVSGLLGGDAGEAEVVRAIEEVAAGRPYLSRAYPEPLRALVANHWSAAGPQTREGLSEREG